ncbi:hypothetical protein EAS64_31855 [Trebonia kvetii]|uniref:MFS transporter n=2 Tax=Trebonia kvetii TaxID=2480626 RepID=A0A6P2BTK0_9ACTN|nr:hypothetical protein EAS64_31855 [Trebonia kvetii]
MPAPKAVAACNNGPSWRHAEVRSGRQRIRVRRHAIGTRRARPRLRLGCTQALDTPARGALIPALMPGAAARSSALSGLVLLTGMTAGSALGGWLVAARGPGWVFVLNAVSFAADVVILHALARRVPAPPRLPRTPGQVRQGIRYVTAMPSLRAAMSALTVIGTLAITFQVSIPLLITGTFGGGPAQVGEAFTAVSAGALAGAIWTATRPPRRPITAPAAAALAAGLAGVAAAPHLVVALSVLGVVARRLVDLPHLDPRDPAGC